ncbi:MAG: RnfABCDGE type electron transport complex subunit D [Planctomycetota bacterium]|nr:RnfABCDGE type electron transport complex subunit D [Planctomycetota bacterium]
MNAVAALRDPRHLQILTLSTLWAWAAFALRLPVVGPRPFVVLGVCLATQAIGSRLARIPFEPRSALISGLSLTLLLRGHDPRAWVLAAVVAIGSKFLFRVRGKHIWNPTNAGLAVAVLCFDGSWMSPGAWGQVAVFGFAIVGFGSLILRRTARSDVTWTVVGLWAAMLFGRAWWLGDPLSIPWHQLQNGSFWIFAFLMISDPKTLPDARPMRIAYGAAVTVAAYFWTFVGYRENGWVWALFALAPTVPLLDLAMRAKKFEWPSLAIRSLRSDP